MTGYVRVDTGNNIADGNVISAADLDNEFDGIQAAFNASTGHNHDGTTGEGAPILVLGPTQDVVVGASTVTPKTTNTVDIGSSSLKFKDLYMAGNASIGGTLAVTGVATLTAQPILSSLTASRAVFTDGSKGLVSNAITGTGNVVMSASPTLTGTITAEALTTSSTVTLNGGTANGVPYLNGSKVLTTGSALTFDGSKLTVLPTGAGGGELFKVGFSGGSNYVRIGAYSGYGEVFSETGNMVFGASGANNILLYTNSTLQQSISSNGTTVWNVGGSEQMRLTSTGLGIGTSSPGTKLDVVGAGTFKVDGSGSTTPLILRNNNTASTQVVKLAFDSNGAIKASINAAVYNNDYMTFNVGSDTERMRLDSSGNLGLGVTPSAWLSAFKAFELSSGSIAAISTNELDIGQNNFYSASLGTWAYKNTSGATQYRQTGSEHRWFTAPSGTAGNAISFTQAMTLDASGNLAIGTTAANEKVMIASSASASYIQICDSSTGTTSGDGLFLGSFNGAAELKTKENTSLAFGTNNTERARIDSSGNLLVGTTSVPYSMTAGRITAGNTGAGFYAANFYASTTSATTVVAFGNPNGVVGSVSTSATTTSYVTSSDYRLKNITGPITASGAYIDSLNPVEGTWKADGSTFVGLIAHEVQEASRTTVATGVKDGEEMQGMDYSSAEIIANLIAEVKSLRQRLAAAGI